MIKRKMRLFSLLGIIAIVAWIIVSVVPAQPYIIPDQVNDNKGVLNRHSTVVIVLPVNNSLKVPIANANVGFYYPNGTRMAGDWRIISSPAYEKHAYRTYHTQKPYSLIHPGLHRGTRIINRSPYVHARGRYYDGSRFQPWRKYPPEENETNENSEASVIKITYNFGRPVITRLNGGYASVTIPGLSKTCSAGMPKLPFETAEILLPYKEKLDNIQVIPGREMFLGRGYSIEYGKPSLTYIPTIPPIFPFNESLVFPACINVSLPPSAPNATVYNSTDEYLPELYSKFIPVQDLCGYKILYLHLYPLRYVPKTGQIWYYKSMTVVVRTKPIEQPSGALDFFRGLPEDRARVLEKVDNPEMIDTYKK